MPGRIVDVSSNNHPNGARIDWVAVRAAGVTTALVKATEGTNYVNPYHFADTMGAASAGLAVMSYHFAGTGDPAQEARFFLKTAGPKLARCLDIETSTNVAWCQHFLGVLNLDQAQCLTYGSASTLGTIYQRLPSLAWPAAYGQNYPGWGVMWQFTDRSTIPGIAVPTDESSWHGTQAQFDDLFGIHPPPQPPNLEEDMQLIVTTPTKQYVVATDLSHKTWVSDTPDLVNLDGTKQYIHVNLSDELVNTIPG